MNAFVQGQRTILTSPKLTSEQCAFLSRYLGVGVRVRQGDESVVIDAVIPKKRLESGLLALRYDMGLGDSDDASN